MEKKQWKWLAISVAFSTVVLLIVLWLTIDENTIDYLQHAKLQYLIFALVLHMGAFVFWALRMKMMSHSLGYHVPFLHSLNAVFANLLVAAITPSQAGGEPVRIHELYRADVPIGDATAVVIMERVIDGIVLGIIGIFSFLLLAFQVSDLDVNLTTPLLVMWALLVVVLAIFVYSIRHPDFLKRLIKRISGWFTKRWKSEKVERFRDRIDEEVDNFNSALTKFIGKARSGLFWGFLFTALYWIAEFLIPSFILIALGEPPHFLESFIVQLMIAIIMMIPLTPGGSGIAEIGATSLYGLFVPSSIVGVFVLIWRLIMYYFNIFAGVLASVFIVRREMILRQIKRLKRT
ncbi:lysylphosphatidylglycerol synthetase [Methanomicrobiaceae archaeon CYW5]|uniref:lysylphosphatidylglycerol synthase transmembrane domain-containing protein n=1 Tax=Methanovulcanius yangii TaxID=1789227 RepID=UPI0029CA84D8|nr:flippase-like domain-containing protein [Methanovulcanius yangii]MBT8507501.1 lysylphosphatidylglycerol synthetase [Methanovulcanius yangii]